MYNHRYALSFILILVFLIPIPVYTSAREQPEKQLTIASGEAWLTGYTYRKMYNITGSTGAGTNYPMKITVYYSDEYDVVDYMIDNGIAYPMSGAGANQPFAYFYNDVTYITYLGDDTQPDAYMVAYNHTSDDWSATVEVAAGSLDAEDTHGKPAMVIDANGYLHVFWDCHNTDMRHDKSDNPESITSWTQQSSPAPNSSYPHLAQVGSATYLLYRHTVSAGAHNIWSFKNGTNAASWSARSDIIDFGIGHAITLTANSMMKSMV